MLTATGSSWDKSLSEKQRRFLHRREISGNTALKHWLSIRTIKGIIYPDFVFQCNNAK